MIIDRIVVGELFTNCYLVKNRKEVIVIDPASEPERILRGIEKLQVKYIINTHGHIDHIGADLEIKKLTLAKLLIHSLDAPLLSILSIEPDVLLKEGDMISIGEVKLKILHTPGHTRGSICLLGDGFAITGDTLFKDGIGRTDLPGGSEEDILRSLEKLKGYLKEGMMIYPGHGDIAKFEEVEFYE